MSHPGEAPEVIDMAQGAWTEAVRRARVGTELKLALLVVGSYANADGTGIYCGVARLAADCEVSYRTAGRYLAWMRRNGFLTLVQRGNRRRGKADVYRLTLATDVADRISLPDPDEYRALVGGISAANRADSAARQRRAAPAGSTDTTGDRRTPEPPVSTDTDDDRRSDSDLRIQGDRRNEPSEPTPTDTQVSVGTRFYGHEAEFSTDIHGVLPPPMDHLSSTTDLPWERPDVPGPYRSARAGAREDPISTDTPRAAGPACDTCGAALDPDGTCFVCRTVPRRT
ncbi:hypothetical protein [Spongiactinospora gelatinilytica]|nr:hypothetical protein [Spongiactinospora gelatinilytica]